MLTQNPMNEQALTHPITLLLFGALLSVGAYIIKMVLDNNRLLGTIADTLKQTIETVKVIQEDQKQARTDLDELRGEHHMMMNAGDMIANHDFKKKRQAK